MRFKLLTKETKIKETVFPAWKKTYYRHKRQFIDTLQKKTCHWRRHQKIVLLSLVIIFFGGSYTTILYTTIFQKNKTDLHVILNQQGIKDSINIRLPENFLPQNRKHPKPP